MDGITDEKDPRVIAEHAVARAARREYRNEASFAASGLPFELYTDAERAPVGAAFPMAGAVTTVAPDFAEINKAEERPSARPPTVTKPPPPPPELDTVSYSAPPMCTGYSMIKQSQINERVFHGSHHQCLHCM